MKYFIPLLFLLAACTSPESISGIPEVHIHEMPNTRVKRRLIFKAPGMAQTQAELITQNFPREVAKKIDDTRIGASFARIHFLSGRGDTLLTTSTISAISSCNGRFLYKDRKLPGPFLVFDHFSNTFFPDGKMDLRSEDPYY